MVLYSYIYVLPDQFLFELRGPSTLTWELRTGDCKTTLEDKNKIGNLTYYISSESLRDTESEKNN